ncbi:MAG: cytochrome c oxidase assembly factor Coa1 family protein [Maribacter sp.]
MDENVPYKNWFKRNRIWLLSIFVLFFLIFISLPKGFTRVASHTIIGYSDTKLADSAISIANKSRRIQEMLGTLKPIDQLTILEGYVSYSKNLDSVRMALRVKGTKGKGKIDIFAFKKDKTWHYEQIDIRVNQPKFRKETIPISLDTD